MHDSSDSSAKKKRLFPMRLTSIEKFHFYDDSVPFPNNLFCRIRFRGAVDREKAVEAIRFFESRHPLISAVVRQHGSRLIWEECTPPSQTASWGDGLDAPTFGRLDLEKQAGVQLRFNVGPAETEIWVHAHHATLDGAAGIQIANEWMTAYGNLVAGRPVGTGITQLDSSLVRSRNSLGLWKRDYARHLHKQPIALFGATKFLFRKFGLLTNSIVNRSSPVELHQPFPMIVGRWLDTSIVEQVRGQAKAHAVQLNTMLLAHLYLAIWKWRKENCFGRPDDWLRVLMPMSIRGMWDRRLPAANRTAVVQIDRRPADFGDRQKFLSGLDREVEIIRTWHLNKMFLIAIRAMSTFPGWLRSSAKQDKYRGTIVFTNLGFPFSRNRRLKTAGGIAAGDLQLLDFDWVGPIRKGIGVNLSIQLHEARIKLSLHVDPRQVDVSAATELMDRYVEHLSSDAFALDSSGQ